MHTDPGDCISDSLRELIVGNSEVMLDLVGALVALHKNGMQDPRIGSRCA
jgi:hypothetical protein